MRHEVGSSSQDKGLSILGQCWPTRQGQMKLGGGDGGETAQKGFIRHLGLMMESLNRLPEGYSVTDPLRLGQAQGGSQKKGKEE